MFYWSAGEGHPKMEGAGEVVAWALLDRKDGDDRISLMEYGVELGLGVDVKELILSPSENPSFLDETRPLGPSVKPGRAERRAESDLEQFLRVVGVHSGQQLAKTCVDLGTIYKRWG
ncbi:hypothetical protein E4U53_003206 [Claviceps sorghi]|nr:hypothetical protein E4U53_003206 [Claviceps sorghi]